METGTALATPDSIKALLAAQEPSKYATELAEKTVTKVGDWLPFLQLYGNNSSEVKRGEFPMGHFGLRKSKKNIVDLGKEVPIFVFDWRPKAMIYSPDVLSYFDVLLPEFKEIERTADNKDSGKGFGVEFLIWLPTVKELATYFMGNKTGRNESPNILGPLKKNGPYACLQKSELIETKKYSWHGPKTAPYDLEIEMPPMELLSVQLQKFRNPPAVQQELAEDEDERA